MKLVEKHIIRPHDKRYKELDHICFLSKNLYNSTLYTVRQHFCNTAQYLNYNAVNKLFTDTQQKDYCALPRKVGKMVQMLVDQEFKSFFTNNKNYKQGKSSVKPKIPKYLDSIKGRQVVTYTKQALSFKIKGYVKLSGTSILIKTNKTNVSFVRVVPRNNYIVVEVGYGISSNPMLSNNNRYASIDLGINNLATITSNVTTPIIINGKPIKDINHYYNKQMAYYTSVLTKVNKEYTSHRLQSISLNRDNKISDYFHKSTRFIVNYLVFNNINTLIIGYNKGWKQNTNMGVKNNQKFVQIPFVKFVDMLKYKCELCGIEVVIQQEAYTSKCSFLDNEDICFHDEYMGKRIKRGLFKSSKGLQINADVNGSYNIMKKYLIKNAVWNEKLFSDCIKVCSTPIIKSF